MACLDMYNSEQKNSHHHHCAPMSPRISFSNDFVETQQMMKQERGSNREAPPVSSDFEFSVTNYSMMSADELFFKGKLLPFKDNCSGNQIQRTLRDELLVDDENDGQISFRPPKGSSSTTRWKGLLGLRRTHIGSKKADKDDETKKPVFGHQDTHVSKSSQELLSEGGSDCRNVEIGI